MLWKEGRPAPVWGAGLPCESSEKERASFRWKLAREVLMQTELLDLCDHEHVRRGDVVALGRRGLRIAGGHDDDVARIDKAALLCDIEGLIEGRGERALLDGLDGLDAPGEAALADRVLARGQSDDRQGRTEVGDQASGTARVRRAEEALTRSAVVTEAKPMEELTLRTPSRSW